MQGTSQSFSLKANRDFTSITPTVANQALSKENLFNCCYKNVSIGRLKLVYDISDLDNTICVSAAYIIWWVTHF